MIATAGARSRRGVSTRLLRNLASVLMLTGILLLLDAGVTLLWQEPVTAVIGLIDRADVNQRFVNGPLPTLDRYAARRLAGPWQRMAYLARREAHQVPVGAALGRLRIPKLHGRFELVQGTDESSLHAGPGHYPGTALPGLGRTVAVAGHRTTYGAPFRHLDALARGDRIVVRMPYGRFTYVVQYRRIVAPTALWVTRDVGYDRLVLTACNPLYSAAQRIVVFARLAQAVPARF